MVRAEIRIGAYRVKRVAILGCGPSGLLAAHAAQINGCDFTIYSKKRPSRLFGSQYLHKPIVGITGVPAKVSYHLVGNPMDYRKKVYGDSWDGFISPEELDTDHEAWDIRSAYDELWRRYSMYIHDKALHWDTVNWEHWAKYDMVISTVPRKLWANPGDKFLSAKVWALGDAPDLGQMVPFRPAEDNVVICDGTEDIGWYRLSKVFDHCTVEWPDGHKPPIEGIVQVEKPLSHNSLAAPDFVHIGRYGAWQKGVLTTDAFDEALKVTA